jgi:hypothetical protein
MLGRQASIVVFGGQIPVVGSSSLSREWKPECKERRYPPLDGAPSPCRITLRHAPSAHQGKRAFCPPITFPLK